MTAFHATDPGLRELAAGSWPRPSAVLVAVVLGALLTTGLHPAVTGADDGWRAAAGSADAGPGGQDAAASDTLLLTGSVSPRGGPRTVDGPPAACPVVVMERLRYVFRWHMDFPGDLRPGDSFRAVLLATPTPGATRGNGGPEPQETLSVLGAEIETRGHPTRAIGRSAADGEGRRFYAPDGTPVGATRIPTPDGFRMTSRFDWGRVHPVLREERPHLGVDYAVPYGGVVRAVAAGRVSRVKRDPGLGLVIRVRHDAHRSTRYAHLSSVEAGIAPGAPVEAGEPLGRAGATGLATAPHLHFELLLDGRPRNPLAQHADRLFPRRSTVAGSAFLDGQDRILELLEGRTGADPMLARMALDGNRGRGPAATTAERVQGLWESGYGIVTEARRGTLARWPLRDRPEPQQAGRPESPHPPGSDASGTGITCTLDPVHANRGGGAPRYWISAGADRGASGGGLPVWEVETGSASPPR